MWKKNGRDTDLDINDIGSKISLFPAVIAELNAGFRSVFLSQPCETQRETQRPLREPKSTTSHFLF